MIYALAVSATKNDRRGSTNGCMAAYARAHNQVEAEGVGLQHARKILPASDGWYNHQVSVAEVEAQFILEEAALLGR